MEKPLIVVATKIDATTDRTRLEALRDFCAKNHLEFHAISAPTGEGVKELVRSIADALDKIPRAIPDAESHPEPAGTSAAATSEPGTVGAEADLPLVSGEEDS
jgi:GTPase Era involved in 16S rRNA processing